jgi:hypothetical protein
VHHHKAKPQHKPAVHKAKPKPVTTPAPAPAVNQVATQVAPVSFVPLAHKGSAHSVNSSLLAVGCLLLLLLTLASVSVSRAALAASARRGRF